MRVHYIYRIAQLFFAAPKLKPLHGQKDIRMCVHVYKKLHTELQHNMKIKDSIHNEHDKFYRDR